MAFATRINESIRGRNLGFEFITSGVHGSTQGGRLLVGPESQRVTNTTAETTAKNLRAWGFSIFGVTNADTPVYAIDPPVPGAGPKIISLSCGASDFPLWFKTANGEFIVTTMGSASITAFRMSTAGTVVLWPVSTAKWAAPHLTTASTAMTYGATST
jgi:hypothetical protein